MKKKIIIGVDIRDLRVAKTGTKTYLEELCRAFKLLEDESCLFRFIDTSVKVYQGNSKAGKYIEHIRYQLWKQLILPVKAWRRKCDILFCTDNFVPLLHLGYQTVPVFHDAFFFENPEQYGKLWLKLYHLTAIPAARNSAFIVTPTIYAKQQIHKYTSIAPAQLKVIHEGPKTMSIPEKTDILSKFHLEQSNYILHVGSMFKRKNIPMLIEAFKQLKDQHGTSLKLVLAGPLSASKDSNDFDSIQQAIAGTGLGKDIVITGYLADSELASIYSGALMYVFPSINEGFGIPVLEAFKYNLPVLVANNTALPEVGGDAVITFDPFDSNDICKKMESVMLNKSLREDLIAKGKLRLLQFQWNQSAAQLIYLFKEIKA
jgi:glycosyltransferase involved in cell wall biosynthesis